MSYAYPMDSILSYDENGVPQYDRAINSAQLRTLYHELLSDGVLLNNSTNLQVVANSTMNVTVKAGLCNIQGCIKKFEEDIEVTIESASTSYNRIDTIVARLDLNSDYRDIGIFVIKGTPASVPTRPELTRDTNVYEIALADILISANATTLSQSNISDTRLDTARCGIISCIAEFDTTKLYEQIQADLKKFQESNEADFEQWFETMKGQLGEDAAGNLQLQIDEHTEKSVPSEVGAHGFRYFEGYVEAHIYDEESRTLKWVRVPGSGIDYDGDKSVKGAIDDVSRTLGYTKSYNLLPFSKITGVWNGITTTPVLNDDNSLAYYSISGSRTSETYYVIYNSDKFPKGVEAGKTYKVSANSTNSLIKIQIYEFIGGIATMTVLTDTEQDWTPSANITKIEVRIAVDSNASGLNDVRIYPMIRPSDIEDSAYKPYVPSVDENFGEIKYWTPKGSVAYSNRNYYIKSKNTLKVWYQTAITSELNATNSVFNLCDNICSTFGLKSHLNAWNTTYCLNYNVAPYRYFTITGNANNNILSVGYTGTTIPTGTNIYGYLEFAIDVQEN